MQSSILHVFILLHMGLFPKNMEIISQMSLSKWLEEAASPHRLWCCVRLCDVRLSFWVRQPNVHANTRHQFPSESQSKQKLAFGILRDDPCATMGRSLVFGLPGILSHLKYCWWFLSCALVERIAPLIQTKIFCSTHFESTAGWQLVLSQTLTDLRNATESFTSGTPKRGDSLRASPKYSQAILDNIGK